VGASYESFVIENLLTCAPQSVQGYFYRTGGGAEIDLVLAFPDGRLWAVAVKRSLVPKPGRGFHAGCADLSPERKFIVCPGAERYRITEDVEAIPLAALAAQLALA